MAIYNQIQNIIKKLARLANINLCSKLNLCNKNNTNDTDASFIIKHIKFNEAGLVPAIAQQYDTAEVLMMAWMNLESILQTLQTGQVCYFSRSRQKLWCKGESSGQVQLLKSMIIDCDGDTLLLKIDQTGVACHTGRKSCFFNTVSGNEIIINQDIIVPEETLYNGKNK